MLNINYLNTYKISIFFDCYIKIINLNVEQSIQFKYCIFNIIIIIIIIIII